MFIQRHTKRTIKANEDIMDPNVVEDEVMEEEEIVEGEGEGEVIVDPEATDLLFEAEDVAELLAEVTGETVEVEVTDDAVEFAIGEDVYTVEAEGDEEVLEAATKKVLRGKRTIAASTRRVRAAQTQKRQVAAATKTVRRVPAKKPVSASNSEAAIMAANAIDVNPSKLIAKANKLLQKQGSSCQLKRSGQGYVLTDGSDSCEFDSDDLQQPVKKFIQLVVNNAW